MGEVKNKAVPGFWRRNWLSLVIIGILSWTGLACWQVIVRISPFLIIVHAFFLYLFVVKLLYDNRLVCDWLFTKLREGGWVLIRMVVHPGVAIWQKCAAGMDLLTQRLGVEQELVIAEKRKKKLELELSHRKLHALLAQMPTDMPTLPDLFVKTEPPVVPIEEKTLLQDGELKGKTVGDVSDSLGTENTERVPPYAKYTPVLMDYLEQVRWERFSVSQAQLILHKRFGTVKLVLEELVHQQKLEYVKTGKRVAYRPVTYGNNEQ